MPETDMSEHSTGSAGVAPRRTGFAEACGRTWHAVLAVSLLVSVSACTRGSVENFQQANIEGTEHVCSSCHGPHGRSISSDFPRLAGQQKDYLETQLEAFRDHDRADPHAQTYMWGMAAKLNDATIDGLASFYSSQKPAPGSPQDPVEVAAGKKLFDDGVLDKGVPACMACHGAEAEGAGTIPRLAGQHRASIRRQLAAFAANTRVNAVMHRELMSLTDQQIAEVSAYLAAQ